MSTRTYLRKPSAIPHSLAKQVSVVQMPLFGDSIRQQQLPETSLPTQDSRPVVDAQAIEELHDLIMAQYEMSLFERRIFLKMIQLLPDTLLHRDGLTHFEPITIEAKEIIADSGLKGESAFEQLQTATTDLIRHVCRFAEADGLLQVGLLSSAKYLKGQGRIRLQFDPTLHMYLAKVKARFSEQQLKVLLTFRSYYTQCLYELFCKTTKPQGQLLITLDQLRSILRLEQQTYERYYDFKRYVLWQSQKELADTEFAFSFQEKKSGGRVAALRFYFSRLNEQPGS